MDRLVSSDDLHRTSDTVIFYSVAQTSLSSVNGQPSRTTASQGKWLFEKMITALIAQIKVPIREEPPLAAEFWTSLPRTPCY